MSGNNSSCAAPDQKSDAVEYRAIPGFPGYRIGTNGEVQTAWMRRSNGGRGGTRSEIGTEWKRLVPRTHSKGYQLVSLRYETGKCKLRYVHQLVLEVFVGPRPKGAFGCHEDDDPTHNWLSNLRWDSPSANQEDWRGSLIRATVNGRSRTLRELSISSGLSTQLIASRIKRGWKPEDAVSMPPDQHVHYTNRPRTITAGLPG